MRLAWLRYVLVLAGITAALLTAANPASSPAAYRNLPGAPNSRPHPQAGSIAAANAAPKLKHHMRFMQTNMQEPTYDSPLCAAVLEGDAAQVRSLLAAGKDPNQAVKSTGRNPLMVASYHYDPAIFKLLLEAGGDPNWTDNHDDTPLHLAAWKNLPEAVALLAAHGGDVNQRNFNKQTPLWIVCAYDMEDWITGERNRALAGGKALLDAGADPDLPDEDGNTPLQMASITRWPEMVQVLLAHGARDDLLSAAIRGDETTLTSMIASPGFSAAADESQLALRYAVLRGQLSTARLLIKRGVAPNLHVAAGLGDLALMQRLLNAGADPQGRPEGLHSLDPAYELPTPMYWAAACGQPAAVKLLTEHGADPNHIEAGWGAPPLLYAVYQKQAASLGAMLEAGADPNAEAAAGWRRAADFATEDDWSEGLALLLKYGAAPDYDLDAWQHEPMATASSGNAACMKLLLDAGVKPVNSERNNLLKNAIDSAAKKPAGALECVRLLLDAGMDPNDWQYASPLLEAIRGEQEDIALALLKAGARPTAEDAQLTPPLHTAALHGMHRMVQALLDAGVDPDCHSPGTTALAIALKAERPEVARVLRSHGASEPSTEDLAVADKLISEGAEKQKQ